MQQIGPAAALFLKSSSDLHVPTFHLYLQGMNANGTIVVCYVLSTRASMDKQLQRQPRHAVEVISPNYDSQRPRQANPTCTT